MIKIKSIVLNERLIILEKEGIKSLGLFGSFALGKSNSKSDIDILLETTPQFVEKYRGWDGFVYLDEIREEISKHFGNVKVDIFDKSCDSPMKKRVEEEAIYV